MSTKNDAYNAKWFPSVKMENRRLLRTPGLPIPRGEVSDDDFEKVK